MFDARSILDALVAGSSEQTRSARESGGLNDIMGDILGQLQKGADGGAQDPFEDQSRSLHERSASQEPDSKTSRNPLDDLFGQLAGGPDRYDQQSQPRHDERSVPQSPSTSTQAVGYEDLLDRVKDLVANNKTAAGAIVGGLGGLLLGTKTGRSLTGRAVRIGGLALIGTLAYKAFQNYQQGASQPEGGQSEERFEMPELPPGGSGFEEQAMTNDDAALFIRTMVAAAASDGQIDRQEQQKILGNLEQAGLEGEAMDFLANEFNNPARAQDIIASVRTREQAAKVYTAARIATEPDTRQEQLFLSNLSERLGLDSTLAAHIDAAASGIKVR